MLAAEAAARAQETARAPKSAAGAGLPAVKHSSTAHEVRGEPVPIRVLGEWESDVGLKLHLAAPPTEAERARVEASVQAWYRAGFDGAFGGAGFHYLSGPSVDGAVMRDFADLGSADPERAVRALAERLAAVPGVVVARLVVGIERVG